LFCNPIGLLALNNTNLAYCRQRMRQELKLLTKARVEMIWRLANTLQEVRVGSRSLNLSLAICCYETLLLSCPEDHRSRKAIQNSLDLAVVALQTWYTVKRSDLINVEENLQNLTAVRVKAEEEDRKNTMGVVNIMDVLPDFNVLKQQRTTKSKKPNRPAPSGFLAKVFRRKSRALEIAAGSTAEDTKHDKKGRTEIGERSQGSAQNEVKLNIIRQYSSTKLNEDDFAPHPDMRHMTPRGTMKSPRPGGIATPMAILREGNSELEPKGTSLEHENSIHNPINNENSVLNQSTMNYNDGENSIGNSPRTVDKYTDLKNRNNESRTITRLNAGQKEMESDVSAVTSLGLVKFKSEMGGSYVSDDKGRASLRKNKGGAETPSLGTRHTPRLRRSPRAREDSSEMGSQESGKPLIGRDTDTKQASQDTSAENHHLIDIKPMG